MKVRTAIVRACRSARGSARSCSSSAFDGVVFRSAIGYQIAWLGVIFFSAALVFAFATLPVEFNASARARAMLTDAGLIYTMR